MNKYDEEVRTFGEDHSRQAEYGYDVALRGLPLVDVLFHCWASSYRLGAASYEALMAGYSVPLKQLRAHFEEFDADHAKIAVESARDEARWARNSGRGSAERGNRGLQG